jgi:hypothetical protein
MKKRRNERFWFLVNSQSALELFFRAPKDFTVNFVSAHRMITTTIIITTTTTRNCSVGFFSLFTSRTRKSTIHRQSIPVQMETCHNESFKCVVENEGKSKNSEDIDIFIHWKRTSKKESLLAVKHVQLRYT